MAISDNTCIFCAGFLGIMAYYAVQASRSKTVTALMYHAPAGYEEFRRGMVQACKDLGYRLNYICITDVGANIQTFINLLKQHATTKEPLICRVPNQEAMDVLLSTARPFVAVGAPGGVHGSLATLHSMPLIQPGTQVAVTTSNEFQPKPVLISSPATFLTDCESMHKALGLFSTNSNKHLVVLDQELVRTQSNATMGLLNARFGGGIHVVPPPSYQDGYSAVQAIR